MTIDEMKQQKTKLANDIAFLVQQFEQQTGMVVEQLKVERYRPANSQSTFTGIGVDISLNG